MTVRSPLVLACCAALGVVLGVHAAITVPTDVQNPGTQPGQVFGLESPDKCDNCHGGYDRSHESAYAWRGSVMSQATRDPIFWATMAVAEQDFDGVGDYCLRCHTPAGWLGGRTTPTDGSGLAAGDADGVCCDTCHKLTNPDDSEFVGVQLAPYVANDEEAAPTGYYGSGMFVMWGRPEKMGPYADSTSKHRSCRSVFQRQSEICGTCHDVSNPAVGDLAPGNGAQVPLEPGTFSGVPGSPVETKAAFRNFPFQYGIVERTFSEHKASLLAATRVADYPGLPAELHAGAIEATYESALVAGQGGDYEDGTPRSFTCQGCHLRPVTGRGCNKGSELRQDLPLHDLTGGNDWVPDAILWLDARGLLRIGGGLTATQKDALLDGKARAQRRLTEAASLTVTGNRLRVVNLTGHKLISGYPEGRRMWLNVKWFDVAGSVLREDGEYGLLEVSLDGRPVLVETLLDLDDPFARVYEAHYALTQAWAQRLLDLGKPAGLALGYDRVTGAVTATLGELAAKPAGSYVKTFHFVLNDAVVHDNRIPPYGMSYDEARRRNVLPVPESQFGAPGPGGSFVHWDEVELVPPVGAAWADIGLLYQPTSWEYVQYLYLDNRRENAFLANEGVNLLEAWRNTGMARPFEMASTTWGTPPAE